MFTADTIRVVVGGKDFTKWSSYEITTDIFAPPAEFTLEIGKTDKATRDWLDDGQKVEIFIDVDGVEQMLLTGRINGHEHWYADGEHFFRVRGFDLAYELQVSSAPFGLKVRDRTFMDVVAELVEPWAIPVTYSNEISRYLAANKPKWKKSSKMSKEEYYGTIKLYQKWYKGGAEFQDACLANGIAVPPHIHDGIVDKYKDAKVDPEESVWDFIVRMANKSDMFLWMSPDGWLTIQRPQYEQDPLYIISHRPSVPRENNVKAGQEVTSLDGVPTELTVFGKVKTKGKKRQPYQAVTASEHTAYAKQNYGLHRPLFLKSKNAHTKDDMEKRAYYVLKEAEQDARLYTFTMAGHSQNGHVWTFDTVAQVFDETLDVDEPLYVSGVQYRRSRTRGTPGPQETDLVCTPLNVWTPKQD